MSDEIDRVSAMFAGRCIFITGATGFLGKVLVEKILRSCPNVKTLYLLVRPKKGKLPKERLKEMFDSPLYDLLKKERGEEAFLSQCRAISGDVSQLDLGLAEEDRKELIENVSIIYHGAATIRFDEFLKKAVLLNTRGTKLMIDLAKECKKLDLFLHISTSYCHLDQRTLYEVPYPPPANPYQIIKCVEWLDDEVVNSMTTKILDKLPNTYAFTKALSEGIVVDAMSEVPAVIVRPSIVIPIWLEPLPGWTDNINGPTGLLIGAGKGVIRTMYCNQNGYADYVPVDITVNGLLVISWNYIANNDKERNILNLTSSDLDEFKVSWQEIIEIGRGVVSSKIPLNGVVWYPGGSMKTSRVHHNIAVFLFHLLPALLIDSLLYVLGYPPVLCRVQRRITKGFEVFEYYANNQWDFNNDKANAVRALLNEKEKTIYKVDGTGMDMVAYFETCIHAARLYILKESDESLPAARRHMRVMYWVDVITKLVLAGLFVYYIGGFLLSLLLRIFSSS